jgi:ferritin
MLKPTKLPSKIVELLNERINDEYMAMYFYRNASNWAEDVGFTKLAAFFAKEALTEAEHAEGLQKYLTDWNVIPSLMPIKKPEMFDGLVDWIQGAYKMEYALYSDYEEVSNKILMEYKDSSTFDFLQKYRTIQTESVAEYATLINKLELIDYTDKNWLVIFEQNNF